MKVLLIQALVTPVFAVIDEAGRPVRTFGVGEQSWTCHHHELAGLQARVEQYEAQQTEELKGGESHSPSEECSEPHTGPQRGDN